MVLCEYRINSQVNKKLIKLRLFCEHVVYESVNKTILITLKHWKQFNKKSIRTLETEIVYNNKVQ